MNALAEELRAWETEPAEVMTMQSGSGQLYFEGLADLLAAQRDYWRAIADRRGGANLPTKLANLAVRLLGDPTEAGDVAGDVVTDLALRVPVWIADLRVFRRGPSNQTSGAWLSGLERIAAEIRLPNRNQKDPRLQVFSDALNTGGLTIELSPRELATSRAFQEAIAFEAQTTLEECLGPEAIGKLATYRLRWRCIDLQRRHAKRLVEAGADGVSDGAATPERQALVKETLGSALERVDRLSADQQAALWYYVRSDPTMWRILTDIRPETARDVADRYPAIVKGVAAIAAEMERSPGAVSALLSRARRELRNATQGEDGE